MAFGVVEHTPKATVNSEHPQLQPAGQVKLKGEATLRARLVQNLAGSQFQLVAVAETTEAAMGTAAEGREMARAGARAPVEGGKGRSRRGNSHTQESKT